MSYQAIKAGRKTKSQRDDITQLAKEGSLNKKENLKNFKLVYFFLILRNIAE